MGTEKNKTLIWAIILGFCFANAAAQKQTEPEKAFKDACDLVDQAPLQALKAFEEFLKSFPDSPLIPRSHYNIGYVGFILHDYDKAANAFRKILKSDYDEKEANGLMEQYALYKHRSARYLAEISLELKQWDDAAHYIKIFHKKYPYQHFCGNEWAAYGIYKATMDARLQEGRGNIDAAVRELVPHIFDNMLASNERAVRLMLDILQRNYGEDEIVRELHAALNSIKQGKKHTTKYEMTLFGVEVKLEEYLFVDMSSTAVVKKSVKGLRVFNTFLD